ncbi:MAG: aspartate aminotransferase family protein [Acidobacteria bacterium]|nr:MAG: aspartate aminotransferase family protein [Acidobacteriota bacterium]
MTTTEVNSPTHSISETIYEKARKVLPGGISRNSIYRKPHPFYVDSAKGCYIKDIEGAEKIDFANNMASLIHGHAHPVIIEAVTKQLQRGSAFNLGTTMEVRYAEHLCGRNKSFQNVRFVNSGSEAVLGLIKTARAYTNKPKIAKAEGAYHGVYDFAEVSQTSNPSNWGDLDKPNSVPVAAGTPKGVINNVVVFPYNDVERTLRILNQHKDDIACVLIDPVPHRIGMIPATKEFVNALYKWTRENGSLLAFDEVITFRTEYGGAQERYDVQSDLTSMAKIIGGGFPGGAIAGSSDIMGVMDPSAKKLLLPHSGTFSGNPVTMTAGRLAMEMYDREAVKKLNALTSVAIKQIEEAIKIADIPACVTGAGSLFRVHLKEKPPTHYREAYMDSRTSMLLAKLLNYLYANGIIMMNTCSAALSTVMTQVEIDRLSETLLNGFKLIKSDIENK